MKLYNIFAISVIVATSISTINLATAQVDPISEIEFLQTGKFHTHENEFYISNEISIREFFNGDIIRVSGQTIEGFPYITYSKILGDNIETHGVIFVNGKFVELFFGKEIIVSDDNTEKSNDLSISVQYTQRVYSKQVVEIDVKIFDAQQNKLNGFYQNYGFIANTNIMITISDQEGQIIFSSEGITNDKGLFKAEYIMPDNSKRETLTITINAENEESKSSKILQLFSFGNRPSHNGP